MSLRAALPRSGIGTRSTRQRPSLLVVGTFLSHAGGSRSVCEDLALRLRDQGWTVHTTSTARGRVGRLTQMLCAVWLLRDRYAVSQVDVFSGPSFIWAAAVTGLLRLIGRPYVLALRGGRLPGFASRWPRLVRWVLGSARTVMAPSPFLQREMTPYNKNILLLPNPLDMSAYTFRLRSEPGPRLVWLRALHEVYNPSLAIQVLANLSRQFPDVSLTMIGRDKGDGSLQKVLATAEEHGVTSRLRIVGGIPKDRVGEALSEGDIFLNTTNVDNTPVSVMEAMACGLCIVSTDVGGMPDLVDDGRDGLLVPPSDSEAMAQAVRRILTDTTLAALLSGNARRKAESFDWATLLPEWERVLRSAANE